MTSAVNMATPICAGRSAASIWSDIGKERIWLSWRLTSARHSLPTRRSTKHSERSCKGRQASDRVFYLVPLITLLTDFGHGSPYVAAMKGVMLSIEPGLTLVDLTHDVPPQNVRYGALVLEEVAERFPAETIHVAVVDPGVGTDRPIVLARIGQQWFIAPDNGLLSRMAMRSPPSQIVRLANAGYWLEPVSKTFHGRDIMAPVAARLAQGLAPAEFGPAHARLLMLDWSEPRLLPHMLEAEVLMVDSFGNLVTNVTGSFLEQSAAGRKPIVACHQSETSEFCHTYGDRPSGTLVSLIGSTGRLELAVVDGSAAERLHAKTGDRVFVSWQ